MATATHSFTVAAPQEKVWKYLSDFPLWRQFLLMRDAKSKGWGSQFTVQGAVEVGTVLKMYNDDALMQEWEIEEWAPPKRFKIASKVFHSLFIKAAKSSISASLTRNAAGKVQVDMEFSAEFSAPLFGYLFNAFIPIKKELRENLERFEAAFKAVLAASA